MSTVTTHPTPSRRNALKHGLTGAGTVLPPEFEAPLAERVAEWSAAFHPTTDAQRFLVRRMALATLRMDQCVAVTAHIEHNHAQKSPDLHALDRQIETQKLINRFDADPTLTRLQLLRTHEGTLHLARRWRTLTHPDALPATPQAIEETLTLLANLLGIHPNHRPSHPRLKKFRTLFENAARPDAPPDARQSAHRRLRALARHHAKQLRHHADINLKPLLDLELTRIAAGLSLPMTPEARLSRRYESAALREFNRSLTLLQKLQTASPISTRSVSEGSFIEGHHPSPCLATPHLTDALDAPDLDDLDDLDSETLTPEEEAELEALDAEDARYEAEYQALLQRHSQPLTR